MWWSNGMDCVRLAKCVSALKERKDLLKVASAFMAENALPLRNHHVNNFTTALKRMQPAVGKAVCVMCQCLNNQKELEQFAESGGIRVLDIVKHVGAGIASVLPLGVMKLAALIYSLLPENDRTTGIDWLVSARAAFNVVQKIWVNRSALEEIRRGIVWRGATSLVRAQLEGLQRHRFVEGSAHVQVDARDLGGRRCGQGRR